MSRTGSDLLEIIMSGRSGAEEKIPEDFLCNGCRYHRPEWDYRYCAFTECRKVKGMQTFREEVYEDAGQ